jgi:hypothetical protein
LNRKAKIAIAVLVSSLIALVVAFNIYKNQYASGRSRSGQLNQSASAEGYTDAPTGNNASHQKELEQKIARLEAQVAVMSSQLNAGRNSGTGNANVDEDATQKEEDESTFDQPALTEVVATNIQRFDDQPYDAAWATPAENSLHSELSNAATELGFQLRGVECRTTDCMATVEFDNYEKVQENAGLLAMRPYSVNCAMRVTTPEPADVNMPYKVKVFFQNCIKDNAAQM